ncbi:MAG: ribbon-helix-helix domain-containing protein [Candidatus Baldrarchaeia archaeon]
MGMVFRVAYNNRSWEAPCDYPGKDPMCWYCFREVTDIIPPKRTDVVCQGHCWEQHLCTEYQWGCYPKGRKFGHRAYPGEMAYFVFKQPDGKYTLWAKSKILDIDDKPAKEGKDYQVGFFFIHFQPFEPLPKEMWVRNLSDIQLVGEKWKQGRYRFINAEQEEYLENSILIQPSESKEPVEKPTTTLPTNNVNLSVSVAPNIQKKLENIAKAEGRQIDEVIREAIAEWVKGRKE